jgi:hypothetical protein
MNGKKAPSCSGASGSSGDNNNEGDQNDEVEMVTYVDKEYCTKSGLMKGLGLAMNNNDDIDKDNQSNLILPFHYAKDLSTASKWLLQKNKNSCNTIDV